MRKIILIVGTCLLSLTILFCGCTEESQTSNETSVPVISLFDVSPSSINPGETANLSWEVTGATNVEITKGIGSVSPTGTCSIEPNETTTYTIIAINSEGIVTATARIGVVGTSETIPSIQFQQNQAGDYLMVATADPSDLVWNNFEINGECNTSGLGIYVRAGDKITDCSGEISITHNPTNTLIGSYTFV